MRSLSYYTFSFAGIEVILLEKLSVFLKKEKKRYVRLGLTAVCRFTISFAHKYDIMNSNTYVEERYAVGYFSDQACIQSV